jgi:F-type H+-transporting ATPase subunit alpha
VRPAVNVGISVSRVGSAAQVTPMKQLAGRLKLELAQFREVEAFATFGSDLEESTLFTLRRGFRLVELFSIQLLYLYAAMKGLLDDYKVERIQEFKSYILSFARRTNLLITLDITKSINDEVFDEFYKVAAKNFN